MAKKFISEFLPNLTSGELASIQSYLEIKDLLGWARQDSFSGSKTLDADDLGSMILTVTGGTVTMFDPAGLSGHIGIQVGSGTLNIDRNVKR